MYHKKRASPGFTRTNDPASKQWLASSAVLDRWAILRFQAVQFQRLRSGRAWCPPALDLLRVDIDELELFEMDPLDPIDGGVIQDMGLGPCSGQGLNMVAGVSESAVDHAGRHLADRLPVHVFG
jgi:hypothetical protein